MARTQRINQVLARRLGISRRRADELLQSGAVTLHGNKLEPGAQVQLLDPIQLHGKAIPTTSPNQTIIFHKPHGYVSSRRPQGSDPTIFDILPPKYHDLKPAGRLDKDSTGLMVLSNDGELIFRLTHPKFQKTKRYQILLDQPLTEAGKAKIEQGVDLDDGISALKLDGTGDAWLVTMHEGRNRQIRRTFDALGYQVKGLHRVQLGDFALGSLASGEVREVTES